MTCSLCRVKIPTTPERDLEAFAIHTGVLDDDLEDNVIRYEWGELRIHRYVSGGNPRTVKIYVCDYCHFVRIRSVIAEWNKKKEEEQHTSASSSKEKYEKDSGD